MLVSCRERLPSHPGERHPSSEPSFPAVASSLCLGFDSTSFELACCGCRRNCVKMLLAVYHLGFNPESGPCYVGIVQSITAQL